MQYAPTLATTVLLFRDTCRSFLFPCPYGEFLLTLQLGRGYHIFVYSMNGWALFGSNDELASCRDIFTLMVQLLKFYFSYYHCMDPSALKE